MLKAILLLLILFSINSYSQVAQQWVRLHNGTGNGNDAGYTIELDASGNVYMAGTSYNTGGTGFDYMIIKYDPAGNVLWTRNYNNTANDTDIATSMTIDGTGNIYVTGRSKGAGTAYDIATVKYNSSGTLQWTQRYNNSAVNLNDLPKKIKIDNSGNLYIAGQSYGTNIDCITIKLNPSTGDTTWVRRYTGYPSNDDYPTDLAIDNLGNPCISATALINIQTYLVFKYNTSGVLQWFDNLAGQGETFAGSIECDNTGNIFVSGGYKISCCYRLYARKYNSVGTVMWTNLDFIPDFSYITDMTLDDSNSIIICVHDLTGSQGGVIHLYKFSTFGDFRWQVNTDYNAPYEFPSSMTLGDSGSIFVTGGQGTNGGDYITMKYNRQGVVQWAQNFNTGGSLFDRGYAIKVDNGGDVYVTGEGNSDITTIRYTQYLPSVPILFSPANNAGNQPLSLSLVWLKSTSAVNYRVQLSTDSLFNTLVLNDSTLTDSMRTVTGLNYSTNYWWRVNAKNILGTSFYSQIWKFTTVAPVGIHPVSNSIPEEFKLYPNHPNPFNPSTVINFDLPVNSFAKLIVYDLLGRETATLVNEQLNAGKYEIIFDAAKYADGVYFYRLQTESFSSVKKMVLLK